MKVKLLNENAKVPTRAHPTDAGADLYATDDVVAYGYDRTLVKTGISVRIPPNHYGRVAPKSGLALKYGLDVLAGVIDETYIGEICVILYNTSKQDVIIKKGEKVAQLIIEPCKYVEFEVVENLEETDRGDGGFGSTGK